MSGQIVQASFFEEKTTFIERNTYFDILKKAVPLHCNISLQYVIRQNLCKGKVLCNWLALILLLEILITI